jgi:hypothetical protein
MLILPFAVPRVPGLLLAKPGLLLAKVMQCVAARCLCPGGRMAGFGPGRAGVVTEQTESGSAGDLKSYHFRIYPPLPAGRHKMQILSGV